MPARCREIRPARRALALLPAIAVGLAGCGGDGGDGGDPMHVQIASSQGETTTLDAAEGESTTITNSLVGDFEVTVESVDDDEAEISTSTDMAPEGDSGGINLNDLQSDFTVAKGGSVTFATPTMDAGTSYTATLEEGAPPS